MSDETKKILLLGGSAQQVIAIETAKRMGYETVLCDYLENNPGQYAADKFYLTSTTDKEAVLHIAQEEKVSGILAYASDPAAPTAAYVAEQLGLPTNPYISVETLCNKDKFRRFLNENGFNTPQAQSFSSLEAAHFGARALRLPVIVKPVDSSGSKGATVLHRWGNLTKAIEFAFSYSRCNKIIIEEYIEKAHRYLIGGDIFVLDGKVVLWGLLNCHRDSRVNPLVPVGKSFPLALDDRCIGLVHDTLQKIVNRLDIQFGAINVEIVIDKDNRIYPIDIGPRAGGNMIPDLLGMIFHVDVVEIAVKAAMGETVYINVGEGVPFYATHNLHSERNAIYHVVEFSPQLERYLIKKCIYVKPGDRIEYFDNASKALGIVFFKFPSEAEMFSTLDDINNLIAIKSSHE